MYAHCSLSECLVLFCKCLELGKSLCMSIYVDVLLTCARRYNVEPFFFSSSLNWIPSRYQACVLIHHHPIICLSLLCRKIPSLKMEIVRPYLVQITKPILTSTLFSDITVTLTFLRSVDQPSATDPPDWSTVSSKSVSKGGASSRSPLSSISDQFAEIEAIDTHAPLLLRSSIYSFIQLKSGECVMLMLVGRQQIALSGSTRDPYGPQRQ